MNKQIRIVQKNENELKVFIKQNNFFAGIINLKSRIFFHVPRSSKNVFHLFGQPGLGINEDILLRKDFDKIMIKFNDQILETTRLLWVDKGVTSPYCNELVDKQIILSIDKITLQNKDINPEQDLFNEVI